MTTFSTLFAPRNRTATGLAVLAITVEDANGVRTYDPNGLIIACAEGALKGLAPLPGVNSDISSAPAVVMSTDELRLALTPDELQRLVFRSLSPREFFALAYKYGVFFEIHDDFYDEETGVALQPKDQDRACSEVRDSPSADWLELVDETGAVVFEGHSLKPADLKPILAHYGIEARVVNNHPFD